MRHEQAWPRAASSPKRVVVLGAGPAGLAVAHELSRRAVSATVLERNPYVGGLAATFQHKGFKFDLGGHRWFTKNEDLNTWFRRLMDGEIVMVNRISRIFHGGRFFKYPIEVRDIIRNTNPFDLSRIVLSFLANSFWRTVAGTHIANMEDAYVDQFGRVLYRMFFQQYSEKLWGAPCRELSGDWVGQRSKGITVLRLIHNALFGPPKDVVSLVSTFMYPRDGYGRISERMAADVRDAGNDILLSRAVSRIVYHGPGDFEIFFRHKDAEESLRADAVVSTVPLGRLVGMLEPAVDEEILKLSGSLRFRSIVTVNVMLRRRQVSPDTWLYVQDRDVIFGRLHEPKNWSTAMVPDQDQTSLVLECFCSEGDEIWSMPDEEIVRRCIDDLSQKLGFIEAGDLIDYKVLRARDAYPVYDLEYSSKLTAIRGALSSYVGLNVVGRGGTFRYNNADHSIEMGLLLARRLTGDKVDPDAVNSESEYHEEITQRPSRPRGDADAEAGAVGRRHVR